MMVAWTKGWHWRSREIDGFGRFLGEESIGHVDGIECVEGE